MKRGDRTERKLWRRKLETRGDCRPDQRTNTGNFDRKLTDAATRKVPPEGLLEGVTVVYAEPAVRAARKAAVVLVEPDVQQLVRVLPAVALQVERHC